MFDNKNRRQFEKVKEIFAKAQENKDRADEITGLSWNEMSEAVVYTPDMLNDLYIKYVPDPFEGLPQKGAKIKVVNADSFEAALSFKDQKTLVLNFANAFTPGGGVEEGASTQEESLCRRSTLYASLTSDNASALYEANNAAKDSGKPETDALIISPEVSVFCNMKFDHLPKPFVTAVMTYAAVDKRFNFKNLFKNNNALAKDTMKRRIRYMLSAAAENGYEDLILGAWGCGAFGNSPEDVAGYFREILIEEGFTKYFNNIIFAVVCRRPDTDANYTAFEEAFAGDIISFCEKDGMNGYLNNSYRSEITDGGMTFTSADQYFFYNKAKLFGDKNDTDLIMNSEDTEEMRKFCSKFKNYDSSRWNGIRELIMHRALFLKFTQNEDLKQKLIETGSSSIINCREKDRIWGIGIDIKDEKRFFHSKYPGANLLGYCLEYVRNEISSK